MRENVNRVTAQSLNENIRESPTVLRTEIFCEDDGMAAGKVQMGRVSRGMKAERVFTVAKKEFADQLTGWRFLVILALFFAVAYTRFMRMDIR